MFYNNQSSPVNEKQLSAKFDRHDLSNAKIIDNNLDVVTEKMSKSTFDDHSNIHSKFDHIKNVHKQFQMKYNHNIF